MSTTPLGDPRSGRDRRGPERRVPSRKHAFERNTVDPISTVKRPLFTIGNGILLACIVAYGMYATGHLPQLDAFFDNADKYGKAHNSTVVNGLLTYGTYLFFGVIALLVALIVFGIVQANRKGHADRRVDEMEDRRRAERRAPREDLPSLVMPVGKERPARRATDKPAPVVPVDKPAEAPIAAKTETPSAAKAETPAVAATQTTAKPFFETKDDTFAKAAALAAAAKAEEAALNGPQDPSSFVPMPGKERLRPAKADDAVAAVKAPTVVAETSKPAVAAEAAKPQPVVANVPATDTSILNPAATNAATEAAIAQAKAAALQAEAAIAMAKAEAAIAQAKAEAAIAEAAAAAAKAAALSN